MELKPQQGAVVKEKHRPVEASAAIDVAHSPNRSPHLSPTDGTPVAQPLALYQAELLRKMASLLQKLAAVSRKTQGDRPEVLLPALCIAAHWSADDTQGVPLYPLQ